MSHEDPITLNSQVYYIDGPVIGKPASEYSSGLKVGRISYDERLGAFYFTMEDFSAGINRRRIDIKEPGDLVFDDSDGVDLRRARHVTLPPPIVSGSLTAPPALYDYTKRQPSVPITGGDASGTPFNFMGLGGSLYRSADGGVSWTWATDIDSAYMISRILEFPDGAGTAAYWAFPEGGGVAKYQKSTDGLAWADGGTGTTKVVEDAIVYQMGGNNPILIGTMPIAKIIFSTDGATWNIDDPLDATPLWAASYGRVQFVGLYMGPWGGSAVYFIARDDAGLGTLYALDFSARQAVKIPLGNKMHIHDGIIWNGFIVVTDGWNVYLYNPNGSEQVRNITFPRREGLAPSISNAVIVKLIGGTGYLYALLYRSDGSSQVICWNENGWSNYGQKVASMASVVCGICSWWTPSTVLTTRKIVMVGANGFGAVTGVKVRAISLPTQGEIPIVGTDTFDGGPLSYITGWFDGGFRELSGPAFKMHIDAFNLSATSYVKVEYQLDNNEGGAWTQMRTSADVAATFTSINDTLYFHAAVPKKGVEFKTIRFRITLASAGGTATPELVALVFVYYKKPLLRTTWTAKIDVSRMIEDKVLVGGVAATWANVWAALKAVWDTKPLVQLDVPSIASGMLVQLVDMPLTVDDFRTQVKGQGSVTITMLEPIV